MTIDMTALLWFLLDVSLRACAAAAAAALVLKVVNVRAAAVRHAVWTTVVVAMLLMPLLPSVVPALPLPALTQLAPVGEEIDPRDSIEAVPPQPSQPVATLVTGNSVQPATLDTTKNARAGRRQPSSVDASWPLALSSLYAAGLLFFLARLARGWQLMTGLLRHARQSGSISLQPELRKSPGVETAVLESDAIGAPLTAGILRPVVLLPISWRHWTSDVLAAVLAHEMAHVRRGDALVLLVARINRAVFWFHPLAWWLERQLAVTAEHACDEAASAAVAEPRRYAEILLEMAEAVRMHRGRIAWPALGVDGAGALEGRIDRVLRGGFDHTSRSRACATVLMCAAAILVVVACREQVNVAPLREDPELAKRLAQQDENIRKSEAARDMSQAQADELERRLETNPQDFDARRQLVTYYSQSSTVTWDKKVPGLRRHALWLIEHHPEHDVRPPSLSPQYDAEGFAAAKRLWDAHLAKADASPYLVYRAASFFMPHDKPYAEQLILRGMKMDPDSAAIAARMPPDVGGYQWRWQLATLYASALNGSENMFGTYNDLRTHADKVSTTFAQEVRNKLEASTDAQLLARVGSMLTRFRPRSKDPAVQAVHDRIRALGTGYLQRALQLEPNLETAKRAMYFATFEETTSDAARVLRDARKASSRGDLAEAKRLAEDAVKKARALPGDPRSSGVIMTAHHFLAGVAIKEGDNDAALRHLEDSVKVPASDELKYGTPFSWMEPVNRLLKRGERERVAGFLEAFGQLVGTGPEAERLRNDARAIREGRMPSAYQHAAYRETAPSPFKPMQ